MQVQDQFPQQWHLQGHVVDRISSSAPTWRGAFHEDGCVTVTAIAQTDQMKPTVVCILRMRQRTTYHDIGENYSL